MFHNLDEYSDLNLKASFGRRSWNYLHFVGGLLLLAIIKKAPTIKKKNKYKGDHKFI